MSNLTVTQNFNTPQIAKIRGREETQDASASSHKNPFDIWFHPELYRSSGENDDHSLNVLA